MIIVLLILLLFSGVHAEEKPVAIKYYFVDGCPYCEESDSIIDGIEKSYPDVNVTRKNVYKSSLFMDEFLNYGFWKVPAIVINENATFQGEEEITEESIQGTVEEYLSAYTQGNSFFEKGEVYYEEKEYKKASVYLEEAKRLFQIGNYDTNATNELLQKCNSTMGAQNFIFKGDLFLENGDTEKAKEMYSQVKGDEFGSVAEERIENVDVYAQSLQSFDKAVEQYNNGEYDQALDLFYSVDTILVGDKQEECKIYIEKCGKYEDAESLYNEGISLTFTDPVSARKKVMKAGYIYDSLGRNSEKYDILAEAVLNFYIGKTIYATDSDSSIKYFKKAKLSFQEVNFQEGIEKCDHYMVKSKKNYFMYTIPIIVFILVLFGYLYLRYFREKDKNKNNINKKDLKKLAEKHAKGEISLEEFDKKKKEIIK